MDGLVYRSALVFLIRVYAFFRMRLTTLPVRMRRSHSIRMLFAFRLQDVIPVIYRHHRYAFP